MPLTSTLANAGCFGCGPANAIGLHLHFEETEDGVAADFEPRVEYQGWDGVMHGGLVSVLLDEAMAWAAAAKTQMYYTGRLQVRYRKPVQTGKHVRVHGWITRDRGRTLETRAEVRDAAGQTLAEADALFIRGALPE